MPMGATVMDADLGVPRSRLKVDLSALNSATQGNTGSDAVLRQFKDKSEFLENNVKRLTAELARAQVHLPPPLPGPTEPSHCSRSIPWARPYRPPRPPRGRGGPAQAPSGSVQRPQHRRRRGGEQRQQRHD